MNCVISLSLINRSSRDCGTRAFLLIPLVAFSLVFACFSLSPMARAVNPPPDGGYANHNTAEGTDALFTLTSGTDNTAIGYHTLLSNTTGSFNTANGSFALSNNTTGVSNTATGVQALLKNTTGDNNTATGVNALFNNITGDSNTADGVFALFSNTSGKNNTATGFDALLNNTTGTNNTAAGFDALRSNTSGLFNTAIGVEALFSNTNGMQNTAHGVSALRSNTTGHSNTATGVQTLFNNTTGGANTATGLDALFKNTTGSGNTATGIAALLNNVNGGSNTATGSDALQNNTTGDNNTAAGVDALSKNSAGNNNIALGFSAGINLTTGSNNIDIGNAGVAGEANTIRIGTQATQSKTFIAGISGKATSGGVAVYINASGKLGTLTSSRRYKRDVHQMGDASAALYALHPVGFHYKEEVDPDGIPQFGLIAEEVEKVNPDLVARDDQGTVYTVRYEAVNAMLLNEFLKEHSTVQELKSSASRQEAMIAQQQKEIKVLTASLKEQASQIQKINSRLEASKSAPQMVLNDQ